MKKILLLALLLGSSLAFATDTPTPTATNTPTPTSKSPVTYANPTLSPGVANSAMDANDVCNGIAPAQVNTSEKNATTVLYGITPTPAVAYQPEPNQGFQVVLAIPQELGGKNVLTNRYPASTTDNYFSEYRRQELVTKLKDLMCSNEWVTPMPLATAQNIVKNGAWTRYYKTYVNASYPTPSGISPTPTATNTPTPTSAP